MGKVYSGKEQELTYRTKLNSGVTPGTCSNLIISLPKSGSEPLDVLVRTCTNFLDGVFASDAPRQTVKFVGKWLLCNVCVSFEVET